MNLDHFLRLNSGDKADSSHSQAPNSSIVLYGRHAANGTICFFVFALLAFTFLPCVKHNNMTESIFFCLQSSHLHAKNNLPHQHQPPFYIYSIFALLMSIYKHHQEYKT